MQRLLGWIAGAMGGLAAYRWLRRQPRVATEPAPAEPDDRADELRAKLAESREAEPVAAEPSQEEQESPEDRRRRVHEEGRATLDDMKPDGAA
jgi:hypothetical protein